MLALILAQTPSAAAMIEAARAQVAPRPCVYDTASTDITVCGLRHADRYRVPLLVERSTDATLADSATAERAALVHEATPIEQLGPFLVGGGHVGVTTGVGFGPGAGGGKPSIRGARPLAP